MAAVGNAIQGNWGAAAMYGAGAITFGIGALAVGAFKAVKFARGVSKVLRAVKKSSGFEYKGVFATQRQSRVAGRIWVGLRATESPTKRGSVRWVSRSGHRQYRAPENKGRRGWQSNFESGRVGTKYTNNYHVRHR